MRIRTQLLLLRSEGVIAGIYSRLLLYGEDDSVVGPHAIAHASCAWSPNVFEQTGVVVASVDEPRYAITRSA